MVSAADPRAAEAGAEMLRAGGSATDAALAILAGAGGRRTAKFGDRRRRLSWSWPMASGKVETIDGRETAPAAATPDWFKLGGQYLIDTHRQSPAGAALACPAMYR